MECPLKNDKEIFILSLAVLPFAFTCTWQCSTDGIVCEMISGTPRLAD